MRRALQCRELVINMTKKTTNNTLKAIVFVWGIATIIVALSFAPLDATIPTDTIKQVFLAISGSMLMYLSTKC